MTMYFDYFRALELVMLTPTTYARGHIFRLHPVLYSIDFVGKSTYLLHYIFVN